MESQSENTSQPSVRESNTVTESNTEIEMSKDIPDRVEIEETSEDNSKRKRTSEAWNHFKRVKVEDIQFAECNYCKTRLKAPAGYGTTHLHKYYEKVCKKRPRKTDIRQSFLKTNQKVLYVPAPHTAEVLADTLVESLMDWNIDRKVSIITVDNCTTNDAMINHLLQKLPTKDMLLDGKVLHMRCCAHILNLIVKDGLDIIGSSIERIRDSVIYWTASPSRVEKFEETARQVPV
ncbi:UNVERIFIED_CONTAM: hypothetical protein Sangu_1169100 [Sesamum angustifolium]|uniref:BED-type domain-containing protein n=1 Tax=Sesamum angustifolium TaxID=2727405 RepID=A0AAW2P1V6_9LAMI